MYMYIDLCVVLFYCLSPSLMQVHNSILPLVTIFLADELSGCKRIDDFSIKRISVGIEICGNRGCQLRWTGGCSWRPQSMCINFGRTSKKTWGLVLSWWKTCFYMANSGGFSSITHFTRSNWKRSEDNIWFYWRGTLCAMSFQSNQICSINFLGCRPDLAVFNDG